jgi:CRP/FNR family cyclic AMP-dependent transcriptional regulator
VASNSEYVGRVPIFRGLNKKQLDAFGEACQRRALNKHEILFHEGEAGGALYVIVAGRLRVEKLGEDGEMHVLGMRTPGDVIGEMSLVDAMPRSAQIVAASACKLLVLYQQDFERLILQEPTASLAIMQALSKKVREASDLLTDHRSKAVGDRLRDYLRREADESGRVDLGVSQSELAELLGCTREAVNRALQSLAGDGSIVRDGRRRLTVRV